MPAELSIVHMAEPSVASWALQVRGTQMASRAGMSPRKKISSPILVDVTFLNGYKQRPGCFCKDEGGCQLDKSGKNGTADANSCTRHRSN